MFVSRWAGTTAAGLASLIGLTLGCAISLESTRRPATPRPSQPISLTVIWLEPSQLVLQVASKMEDGHYASAVELAVEALQSELSPGDRLAALNHLCVAYPLVGQAERGIATCEEVLLTKPHDWRVINNLGNAYQHGNRLLRAIELYREALEVLLGPEGRDPIARNLLNGRLERGVAIVTRNLELALELLRAVEEREGGPPSLAFQPGGGPEAGF